MLTGEDGYRRGILLFNQREFYDAHEVWEDVWRELRGPEKKFLQGLIQVAVAFHHHSTGNLVGAQSLLLRARRNIEGHREGSRGIGVDGLLVSLQECQVALATESAIPFPRLLLVE